MLINSILSASKTQKTKETKKSYTTQNSDTLFSQNLTEKFETTRKTESITNSFDIEIDSLISVSIDISEDAQLLSCSGASSLSGIAFGASSKCFSLVNSIRSTLATYSSKIAAILSSNYLSESEKEAKIKEITIKIKAIIEEGKAKANELHNITLMLKSMTSAFIALEKAGKSTTPFLMSLKEMINNFNTNPTDLSDLSTQNDIYNKIRDNKNIRFGKNTSVELNENINDTDKEIKDIEQKLKKKDLTKEEKSLLEKELLIHKSLKRVYELFK